MSDEADKGNDTAEFFLAASLSLVKPAQPAHGVGLCLNCGCAVTGEKRWCDVECRGDWERANDRR